MLSRAYRALTLCVIWLGACARPATGPEATEALGPALRGSIPAGLAQTACTPTGPELCFNATDDNCNGIIDEGCGLHTGLVQFVIAWNEPSVDVDLRVIDPHGELVEVGRPSRSGLVKERDCPQDPECRDQNLENVYLSEGDVLRGEYRARIRLVALGAKNPPIRVSFGARVGPKTYSATVTLDKLGGEQELIFRL